MWKGRGAGCRLALMSRDCLLITILLITIPYFLTFIYTCRLIKLELERRSSYTELQNINIALSQIKKGVGLLILTCSQNPIFSN